MIEFLYYHSLNFLKTLDIITQWWGNKFDLEESENEEEEKFALKNFFLTSFHLYLHHSYHIIHEEDLWIRGSFSVLSKSSFYCALLPTPWCPYVPSNTLICGCCCCSVTKLCLTICNSIDCSILDCSVLHHLQEFAQIHVPWVSDAFQLSHPLYPLLLCLQSFPALRCFLMNQLFTSGAQSPGVAASASVLPGNIQGWFSLGWTGLISLLSKGLARVLSSVTVRKHHFFGPQSSLWSNSPIYAWLLVKPELWLYEPLLAKWCLCFLICCLGWPQLSFQDASIFSFHGCSHHLQWF